MVKFDKKNNYKYITYKFYNVKNKQKKVLKTKDYKFIAKI